MLLSLLKLFFPPWQFFDGAGSAPQVFWRWGKTVQTLGEWQSIWQPFPRRIWHLFVNVKGNQRLFDFSQWEGLLQDSQNYLDQPSAFAKSKSYHVCAQQLRVKFTEMNTGDEVFQFKIEALNPSGKREQVLISEPLTRVEKKV